MMDYALEWNGYFIYKNPEGEECLREYYGAQYCRSGCQKSAC